MPSRNDTGTAKTTATTRKLAAAGPEDDHQEDVAADTTGTTGGKNRAALFAQAPVEEGFNFPVGTYNCVLTECNYVVDGEKESVQFKAEVDDTDSEQHGKSVNIWYNFFDEDGKQQRGMGFFKRDLGLLEEGVDAYVEAYTDGAESFEEILWNLANERLQIVVDVKKNKQYTNVYLKGLQSN